MSQPQGPCPVCHKPFEKNDDIVVCPECGAPYHRACYQEQGHCTFNSQHGSGFEYHAEPVQEQTPAPEQNTPPEAPYPPFAQGYQNPAAPKAPRASAPYPPGPEATVVCPSCGAVNDGSAIFCLQCGSPLHAATPEPAAPAFEHLDVSGKTDDIKNVDWARFFGNSSTAYLMRLQQYRGGNRLSFMLSAFVLGPFYYAYRKMWGWAALVFLFWLAGSVPTFLDVMVYAGNPLVAGLSTAMLENIANIIFIITFALRFVWGFAAWPLYRRHCEKKIKALRFEHADEYAYQTALAKKGGVSLVGPIVFFGIIMLLSGFLSVYVGPQVMTDYLNTYLSGL